MSAVSYCEGNFSFGMDYVVARHPSFGVRLAIMNSNQVTCVSATTRI